MFFHITIIDDVRCMVWVMYGGVMYGGDDVWWG